LKKIKQRINIAVQKKEGLRNKKVVGELKAYLASRLTGLRERSVTLELKQGPALTMRAAVWNLGQ